MKKQLLAALLTLAVTPWAWADIRIGVSIAQVDDVFLAQMRDYMAAHAKELPGVTLQFEDAQGDVVRQLNQVQNFTAQGMDAIIVNAVDTAATQKMTVNAQQAKIPLVYVNRRPEFQDVPPGVGYVGSDEIKAGEIQMRYLAEKMGGKGNLAIMLGLLSNNATHNRTLGVKTVLKDYPDIKIVEEQSAEWQRGKAIDLMSNWIVSGRKIDAVAANADEMAIGAAMAISQAGMQPGKDILVAGSDGGAAGLDAVKKGQLLVTVYQDNKGQAVGSIDLAVKMVKKEPYVAELTIPYQQITKDNYQAFLNP
ncbi:sugar ABC transporter substrate-binding protein [Pseudomonas sp. WS 5532]|jgi:ribose transport system substrate-binding protein/inositol transport system substrate-binding protein|uniref:sugar ABC transporter substrate-binding protein n=2 Tax=Pseudomonas TaxID=286 RepID=UPI0002FDE7E5|nr:MULTISPECIES: sugar ABC transporter substrate-binding protein [Pseudomonas]MCF5142950.1 substrate-binding domain-containing protein [Pseudomonas sp. PA-6-3C]MCF5150666.1 substrate-binding domain-containing protein [Pseudomonas sp. PA-6-3F]MCF5160197.1 substrate-binding domain-containing protein [Pseudomonas sp. PA-6-2E]MCF5174090.1 substrate-binding domain-containing protein [Pseudomonas sp. PA-6-1D]MCF5192253.1 substrate-binding domain-containing protein [Pseudomonas sp. PA-6-1H]